MNRVEQAYHDYITAKILPILDGYIGDEISPETAKKINEKIIAQLRDDYIPIEYEVVVDE